MIINYDFPKMKRPCDPPAIYMMKFSTGHYYIGGTSKFKTRVRAWRTRFNVGNLEVGGIPDIMPNVTWVTFSIIENATVDNYKELEKYYINKHKDDPLCINRQYNKNVKITRPPFPKEYVHFGSKPISKFDLFGNFIETYKSISEAARQNNKNLRSVQDVLSGVQKKTGGFVFKYA